MGQRRTRKSQCQLLPSCAPFRGGSIERDTSFSMVDAHTRKFLRKMPTSPTIQSTRCGSYAFPNGNKIQHEPPSARLMEMVSNGTSSSTATRRCIAIRFQIQKEPTFGEES